MWSGTTYWVLRHGLDLCPISTNGISSRRICTYGSLRTDFLPFLGGLVCGFWSYLLHSLVQHDQLIFSNSGNSAIVLSCRIRKQFSNIAMAIQALSLLPRTSISRDVKGSMWVCYLCLFKEYWHFFNPHGKALGFWL